MSSTLYWQPIIKNKKSLSYGLKIKLREYFDVGYIDMIITSEHEDVLRAFAIANIEGAQELLNALINHGDIKLTEEC